MKNSVRDAPNIRVVSVGNVPMQEVSHLHEGEKEFSEPKISRTHVSIKKLAQQIENQANGLENDGYDVISIIGVNSGRYNDEGFQAGYSAAFNSYGFSVTDGVLIVGKKRKEN